MKINGADVYRVGFFAYAYAIWRVLTGGFYKDSKLDYVKLRTRAELGQLRYWAARGQWRCIRNHFNGYLAEHDGHPHDAGSGWTKTRALKDVEEICWDSWISGTR